MISLADPQNPCSNGSVIEATVDFAAGENATVIAHLNEQGAPTASKFVSSLSSGDLGTRVFLHHTAAAPAVDVAVRNTSIRGPATKVALFGVVNGQQGRAGLISGDYRVGVALAGIEGAVLGPLPVTFDEGFAYSIYVVGSANNGTLTAISVKAPLQ
jgi:hypothetical protein